jgi:hypothetical protein
MTEDFLESYKGGNGRDFRGSSVKLGWSGWNTWAKPKKRSEISIKVIRSNKMKFQPAIKLRIIIEASIKKILLKIIHLD